ncbi:MAG: DUF2961 domain-containing protein [Pirellulales bacterium]|nr:DUF2961 domain-containing protein [Pirellulales bacterium]
MRITLFLTLVALFLPSLVAADPLAEVTRTIDAKARRASSGVFDPESNADSWHIKPGQTMDLTTLKGPGEIRHMWFTVMGADRRWRRSLVMRIYWDGAKTPSVETPIGDFFAAGNAMPALVDTLPIQVTSYGRALNCYWHMPFAKSARIELTNEGTSDLCVYWQFDWMEFPRAPKDMLYFHARYRQEFPVKPFSPYVIFEGKGQGHYVGTVFSIQCSYGSWFGEADDRFYIDGEPEPSLVGTGCEDYFNDGWNFREFTNDNTGVTIKEPNGEDCRFTAYRWHVRAPVTFRKSLKVEIERRSFAMVTNPKTGRTEHHDFKYRPDFCSSVAYWYQSTPAERTWPFPSVDQRLNKEIILDLKSMVPQIKTSPGVRARQRSNRVCNQKRAMHVTNDKVGGWFEVPCHVDEKGIYSISVYQCLYRDGGIWKVTLDGPTGPIVLDEAMDFYDPYLAWKENRPENYLHGTWMENKVGLHELPPGDYTIRFECVGSHPLSHRDEKSYAAPGLNCRLDGISLRRFPWDDLYGQLQKYLADEKALFDSWINEAKATVASLDAAIRKYARDTRQYPRTLDDLVRRPSRVAGWNGPYVKAVPRDPWGQLYRYECPGRYAPDAFDVYSVHGNSRDPRVWIGNWNTPFRFQDAIEGEDLRVLDTSAGAAVHSQRARVRSAPVLSNGRLLFVRCHQKGDFVELKLPAPAKPGRYRLRLQLVTADNYGLIQASLNGKPLGEPVDTFSFVLGTKTVVLGPVTIKQKDNVLRLEVVGRGPNSGGYNMGLDAVTLLPTR